MGVSHLKHFCNSFPLLLIGLKNKDYHEEVYPLKIPCSGENQNYKIDYITHDLNLKIFHLHWLGGYRDFQLETAP